MRIAIVTDAWHPQVNGVAITLATTARVARELGHEVSVIEPTQFRRIPCPTYPEIRLAWRPYRRVAALLSEFSPDAIHIATEGPLGWAARRWCMRQRLPFTTSYHTQFPEYLRARVPVPLRFSFALLRRFHGAAARTMVATMSLELTLRTRGFANLARWSRGVNLDLFRPYGKDELTLPRPIAIYVGRVATEKNIEAFLRMQFGGTKVVVGDGPERAALERQFTDTVFLGYRHGEHLARTVAAADVFVFPSRTDTFGLVLLEAMACGVPVAAFPVTGPIDVVEHGVCGVLDHDLARAAKLALQLDPERCRARAQEFTWHNATQQFLNNLSRIVPSAALAPARPSLPNDIVNTSP